jgi:very-short-patch-repair endonuclease
MIKWIKDENGLFVTKCPKCSEIRRTKKRPYGSKSCNNKDCNSGQFKNGHSPIFTEERNKKIADGKKQWWTSQNKDILNDWLGKYRGSEKHINMCKSNQIKATKAALGRKQSKPEIEFENELKNKNVEYKTQYYVGSYAFDFYLPEENLLIEIDGKFYHPLNEEDCVYPIQKHNYVRDIKKSKIALENGYKLKRIRV